MLKIGFNESHLLLDKSRLTGPIKTIESNSLVRVSAVETFTIASCKIELKLNMFFQHKLSYLQYIDMKGKI